MFKIQDKNLKTVKDVVEYRTGISADKFLHPDEAPKIHGLEDAVSCLVNHANRQVTIVGDYDVDGICATTIMHDGLKAYGIESKVRLPHRFSEGYGLSEKIIDEIDSGVVITVDNGIAAKAAIAKAKAKGLIVIVTDHHLAPRDKNNKRILPEADALVDPNAEDFSEYQDYCGAGIAYRFIQELLKDRNCDLSNLLIMASIATVCDVMNLTGANRMIVKKGLEAVNNGKGVPGLRKLMELLSLENYITEEDYGFKIGPTMNAAGRLLDDGAEQVLRVMLMDADDPHLDKKAQELVDWNNERKEIVKNWMPIVERLANGMRPIVIYHPEIEEGIIGIIAANLTEKYQCPSIVFTKAESGNLKGSGRSVDGINLKAILDSIQDKIMKYGGHGGAAGLTIQSGTLEQFRKNFCEAVGMLPEIKDIEVYDLEVRPQELEQIMNDLKLYAPFGIGNPKPIFHIRFSVSNYKRIGDGKSFMMAGKSLSLLGFNLAERYEEQGMPKLIECIGELQENWFKGNCYYRFSVKNFC